MSGKKFILIFTLLVVVSSVAASVWMKHSYDTRPQIPVNTESAPKN